MPRFYFDIHDGAVALPDQDGAELPSLQAAKREASALAAEIARDLLSEGDAQKICVEVRQGQKRLLAVTVTVEVDYVLITPMGSSDRDTRGPA
jgi:hypothetical protein